MKQIANNYSLPLLLPLPLLYVFMCQEFDLFWIVFFYLLLYFVPG